ncbi:MAG: phage tail tape measure protein [Candidatus Limisoma sp.]
MANEITTVETRINGKQAKTELAEMQQRCKDLQKAYADAAKAGDKSAKDIYKELKIARNELRQMQRDVVSVDNVLKNLSKASPKELSTTLRTLTRQLNDIERGSAAWEEQKRKIAAVKAELQKVNTVVGEQEKGWARVKNGIKSWQAGIAAGIGYIKDFVSGIGNSVEAFAAMDHEMTNVQKYTGMTKDQVESLNEEFKKMDTRTSREELNKLAQDAGRLGKTSEEDVLGFVRAADQINVALDDLGEGATLTLSKLTGIFGDEKIYGTETALLKVGSVINELSQNCSASAPFIAEFTSRLGGVASQAHMNISQVMGFAAVLDTANAGLEASSTALSQIIVKLYKEPAKFAEAAGIDVKKFTELVKTDANAALIELLDTMRKSGDMSVLAPMLADMGVKGSEAVKTLTTLAGRIDDVKAQQQAAAEAYAEGTSVTREAEIQNSDYQAQLEKSKKSLHELTIELGMKLASVMTTTNNILVGLGRAFMSVAGWVGEHWRLLVTLTAAIVAYNVAVNLAVIRTKALALWTSAITVLQKAWTAVQMLAAAAVALLSGNVTRATAAFRVFSGVLKANPIGLLVSVITAAVAGLALLITRTKQQSAAQKALNKIKEEAVVKAQDEIRNVNLLVEAMNDVRLSMEERAKAANELNRIIPDYNAQLDATTGKYKSNKKALDDYIASLIRQYEVEGAKAQLSDIGKKRAQARIDLIEAGKSLNAAKQNAANLATQKVAGSGGAAPSSSAMAQMGASAEIAGAERRINKLNDTIKNLDELEKTIVDAYKPGLIASAIASTTPETDGIDPPDDTDKDKGSKPGKFDAEENWQAEQELRAEIAYKQGELSYKQYTEKIAAINDEFYQKILSRTDLSENERLEYTNDMLDAKRKAEEDSAKISAQAEQQRYDENMARWKQRYIDDEISREAYNEGLELIELDHQTRLTQIYKEGTEERKKAEKALQDAQLKSKNENPVKADDGQAAQFKQKYFGNNAEENAAAYAASMSVLDTVYQDEVAKAAGNKEELLRLEEAYQQARLNIAKQYNQEIGDDQVSAAENAYNNMQEFFNSEGYQKTSQAVGNVMGGLNDIFSGVTSLIQANLQMQTDAIEKRYDKEISLAEGNSYKVKKLEDKRDKEIAKAKNKANKKMFAMQIIQAIAQTAQNAITGFGTGLQAGFPLGLVLAPALAAMALVSGGIQIAMIKKQQQQAASTGYAVGGFTKPGAVNEPAGIVHAGEWVASQKLVNNPKTRPLINALEQAQRSNTIGTISSADVSRSITAPMATASAASETKTTSNRDELTSTLQQLNTRLQQPFVTVNTITGDTGIKKAQDDYEKLMRNKNPKTK